MSSINRDELRLVLEFYRNMGLSSIYMDEFRDEKSGKTVGVEEKTEALEDLRENIIGDCRKCRLHEGRKNIVFGEGNPDCEIMFIGEGPGADEDIQGRPFVGKAGQLLTNLIKKMGSDRNDVYIANIVKCRPPGNRNPLPDEARTCM
ncbi:MAG TPA: uracil-DNA glycosylase, partial [Nitrospirae bacterium]|nr:uracil-DNA glycosylase [Nitrospirota bacterium]